jgi:hypothetical protein
MTYLAIIHGARAVQYFIRSPRTSFPKSPIMWAESSALSLEAAELTPALTSVELAPEVTCSIPTVHTACFRDRGIITVLAVNSENKPCVPRFELDAIDFTGQADVMFEDRQVDITAGAIEEPIDAFGTRAYAIPIGPFPEDDLQIAEDNLVRNPSWENNPSVGTPAGNYAGVDPGASMFVDARVARHGQHSVRLTSPSEDATVRMRQFPVKLMGGQEYRLSIWAKGKSEGVKLGLSFGGMMKEDIPLTTDWQEFTYTVTPEEDMRRATVAISLASPGVAWVDVCQVVPVEG